MKVANAIPSSSFTAVSWPAVRLRSVGAQIVRGDEGIGLVGAEEAATVQGVALQVAGGLHVT
jgi:hypothetical protein